MRGLRPPSLVARALATGFALSFAAASATPVQAQTTTLVDDWDVGSSADSLTVRDTAYAQGFTTGSHAEGYELTSIELDWAVAINRDHGRVVVRLRQSRSNKPGGGRWDFNTDTHHYTDFNSTGTKTFLPAAGVTPILEANTTYYVTILPLNFSDQDAALGARDTTSVSSSSAAGWTLQRYLSGSTRGAFSSPSTWTEAASANALRIRLKGKELTALTGEVIERNSETDNHGRLRKVFDLKLSPGSRSPGVRLSAGEMRSLIEATTTNLQEVQAKKIRTERVWDPRSRSVVTVTNHWRLKLLPNDPTQSMTVEIQPDQGCAPASGGLCQVGGGQLSEALTVTFSVAQMQGSVSDAPQLSVSDAEATEGDDTSLDFVVTLSPAASETVTVDYATSDGTATAGQDYASRSGTLTFTAGEATKTISVLIVDDAVEDDGETMILTLSGASGAEIDDAEAVGTIRNTESDSRSSPLTASFGSVPASHDGASAFTFTLSFSEDVGGLSFRTLRDSAFDVTGGSVKRARRQTAGNNQHWNIEVEPDLSADMVISLPETTDCAAAGAICTADGRKLSQAVSATVAGPGATNAAPTGEPTISGTARVNEVLTASVSGISDADGLNNASFEYQWIRGSTDIQGASASSYTVASADEGETIRVRVTFSDDNGNEESLASAATHPVAAAPEPLTASFNGVPSEHTGEKFTFGLTFSEELELSYQTLRDDALEASGGTVQRAKRQQSGSNRSWTIHVKPDSDGAVTVRLPADSVETADGRALSNSPSEIVAGPVGISVADARVEEDAGGGGGAGLRGDA